MGVYTRLTGDPAPADALFSNTELGAQDKAVADPRAAIAVDVALLRAIPQLPGEWLVSGLVYDVDRTC